MEFSEDLLKILITALIVTGVLSVFLIFLYYNIIVNTDKSRRDVFIVGQTLLSNSCLIDDSSGVFSEEKIEQLSSNPLCLNELNINYITITVPDMVGKTWQIDIGNSDLERQTTFDVAVKIDTGETKLAKMVVNI
jgi:hypothetical protein